MWNEFAYEKSSFKIKLEKKTHLKKKTRRKRSINEKKNADEKCAMCMKSMIIEKL